MEDNIKRSQENEARLITIIEEMNTRKAEETNTRRM
jgi:hypothetical protein